MLKKIKMLKKRPLIDVWHYFIGNYRYWLYYKKFKIDYQGYRTNEVYRHSLMRQHIFEQIAWRIKVMDQECYEMGQCKMCGCATTALQMANKACDKPCYPLMMSKKEWEIFKKGNYKTYIDTSVYPYQYSLWIYDMDKYGNTNLGIKTLNLKDNV